MKEFVSKHKIVNDFCLLPLIHTTKFAAFPSIVEKKGLGPEKEDEVTNENLLFFFYGRAEYTIHWNGEKTKNALDVPSNPIAFLFDCKDITPKHIFPFDSGGFMNPKYKDTYAGCADGNDINNFELGEYENIKKLIDICYQDDFIDGKNYSYYHELAIEPCDLGDESVNRYLVCLKKGASRKNKTPEISTVVRVPIEKCKAIVLPSTIRRWKHGEELEKIRKIFDDKKIFYYHPCGNNGNQYLSDCIEHTVNTIIEKEGYVEI